MMKERKKERKKRACTVHYEDEIGNLLVLQRSLVEQKYSRSRFVPAFSLSTIIYLLDATFNIPIASNKLDKLMILTSHSFQTSLRN